MRSVGALVAERAANLKDPFHPADTEPFEIKFGRDPQIEIEVVGVDMGQEWASIGSALNRLEYGRLDFEETPFMQKCAQLTENIAAQADQIAAVGIDGEVDVAAAYAAVSVGQAAPFIGERMQTFGAHSPRGSVHTRSAGLGMSGRSAEVSQIAEVEASPKLGKYGNTETRALKNDLRVAAPIAQIDKDDAAVIVYA